MFLSSSYVEKSNSLCESFRVEDLGGDYVMLSYRILKGQISECPFKWDPESFYVLDDR